MSPRRVIVPLLPIFVASCALLLNQGCNRRAGEAKADAASASRLDGLPPVDFHADVDPWPPPGPVETKVLLEASRASVGSSPRDGHIKDRNYPELHAREGRVGNYDYLEVIFGKCENPDAPLPLIVLLHGRGDRPRVPGLPLIDLPTPVRVLIPRAPDRLGDGYTWLATYTQSGQMHLLARSLSATAAHLAAAVEAFMRERPTVGKPIVVGFSQGAIITFALTTRYPRLFAAGFPVAGFLPEGLEPETKGPFPLIHALHGDADPTVPIEHGRQSVQRLRALGHDIFFSTARGAVHRVTPAMSRTVRRWIGASLFPQHFPEEARSLRVEVQLDPQN